MDKTENAVDVFNKCAIEYQNRYMDIDLYNESFDLFCKNIPKENANILEIACGPGNITKYLLKKRQGFRILGIDLSPNMIDLAKINNPKAEFKLMDCRDISKIPEKYDAIMCGFCLPYLSKEEAVTLIRDASGLLNKNGVMYISTMEDDYSNSGFKLSSSGKHRIFIHYHQEDYLTNTLKENGFIIIDLQRKEYIEQDGSKTTDLLVISEKI